jgi:hypothetical protein
MASRLTAKARWMALGAAALGLGLSMPSCGGSQALQMQVDQLTAKNTEMQGQLQRLGAQVSKMDADLRDARALVEQAGSTIIAQGKAIDQLQEAVNAGRASPAHAPAARAKSSGKKVPKKAAPKAAKKKTTRKKRRASDGE